MAALARELGLDRVVVVANKIRDGRDLEAVREFAGAHELELVGAVPLDDGMPAAERAGVAPLDHDPEMPAVRAIDELADRLVPVAASG
jgi:CO dehydrogenase maturation factor